MCLKAQVKQAMLFALSVFLVGSVYAQEAFESFHGQVSGDEVNVRADSTVSSRILCQLARGEAVDVISESYDWYRIRLPEQASAYIRKDMTVCIDMPGGVATGNSTAVQQAAAPDQQGITPARQGITMPAAPVSQKPCRNAKVIKSDVNIRLEPDENSWIIGMVQESQVLNVLDESGKWYKITPPDNSFGWVYKKFITKAVVTPVTQKPQGPSTDEALQQAKQTGSIIISGMIQPYGHVFGIKAHHKLVTDDNKVFLLRGEKGNLNVLIGRKARITGTLVGQKWTKFPVIEVRSVEAIK